MVIDLITRETVDREQRIIAIQNEDIAVSGRILFKLLKQRLNQLWVALQANLLLRGIRNTARELDVNASPRP